MVSFEGLQGDLLLDFEVAFFKFLNLLGKDNCGFSSRVNAIGLDGEDKASAELKEVLGVDNDDSGLIRLSDISEDAVNSGRDHESVVLGFSSVLNDGDDVGSFLGHVDEISSTSLGVLHSENCSSLKFIIYLIYRTDKIGDVRNGGSIGSSKVEDLGSGLHVNIIHSVHDTGSQLGSESVPHSVFGLDIASIGILVSFFDGNSLLSVDGFSGDHVLGDQKVFLALGDENTSVSVSDNGGSGSSAETRVSASASAATTTASS